MNAKKYMIISLIGFFFMATSQAWAFFGQYGQLKPRWLSSEKVTIVEVYENWQNYDVYYAGLSVENPSAIMFDPKGDEKRLVSDKWVQVKNKDELSDLILWIGATNRFHPVLWRVHSPENQVYGLIYTSAWSHVVIKKKDDRTMWVDDVPLPPIDYGP